MTDNANPLSTLREIERKRQDEARRRSDAMRTLSENGADPAWSDYRAAVQSLDECLMEIERLIWKLRS